MDDSIPGLRRTTVNAAGVRLAAVELGDRSAPAVLLLHDHYVSPRLFDDLDRWAPRLRRRTVDAGHWLPLTHPAQLAGWIGELVDEVEAGRRER